MLIAFWLQNGCCTSRHHIHTHKAESMGREEATASPFYIPQDRKSFLRNPHSMLPVMATQPTKEARKLGHRKLYRLVNVTLGVISHHSVGDIHQKWVNKSSPCSRGKDYTKLWLAGVGEEITWDHLEGFPLQAPEPRAHRPNLGKKTCPQSSYGSVFEIQIGFSFFPSHRLFKSTYSIILHSFKCLL